MAIGDGGNDAEMLRAAGVGVAMERKTRWKGAGSGGLYYGGCEEMWRCAGYRPCLENKETKKRSVKTAIKRHRVIWKRRGFGYAVSRVARPGDAGVFQQDHSKYQSAAPYARLACRGVNIHRLCAVEHSRSQPVPAEACFESTSFQKILQFKRGADFLEMPEYSKRKRQECSLTHSVYRTQEYNYIL